MTDVHQRTAPPLTDEYLAALTARLNHATADIDAEYRATQERLQRLGARRAVLEDAADTIAAMRQYLEQTALVPLRSAARVEAVSRGQAERDAVGSFPVGGDGA